MSGKKYQFVITISLKSDSKDAVLLILKTCTENVLFTHQDHVYST